mmetsp:Transcript_15745/g.22826  ORF Transcript_15745/g.22826 Transcript_15745/m.22826 type:complete len:323 (+) Transcript_15745:190-1158(+)
MTRSFIPATVLFLIAVVATATATAAASVSSLETETSARFLEKGDSRRPGDPIYWEAYREKHGIRFRRCRDFSGVAPKEGSTCNKKKIGNYFCLFGDQMCQDDTHHPTTWCDCEQNEHDTNRHWHCREHLPEECLAQEDNEDFSEDDDYKEDEEDEDDEGEDDEDEDDDDKFTFDPDEFFHESISAEDMDNLPSLEELGQNDLEENDSEDDYDDEEDYEEDEGVEEDEDEFCNGNELIEGKSASASTISRAKKAARYQWIKKVEKLMPLEPEQARWHSAELADYDCKHFKSDGHYKCKAYGIPCAEEDSDSEDDYRRAKTLRK